MNDYTNRMANYLVAKALAQGLNAGVAPQPKPAKGAKPAKKSRKKKTVNSLAIDCPLALLLADFSGKTQEQAFDFIVENFYDTREDLPGDKFTGYTYLTGGLDGKGLAAKYQLLVAYMHEGNWGCDSSAYILVRERATGKLFEVNGSHCSCYGYEGQWKPEETTIEYLVSDKFGFGTGGYDDNRDFHKQTTADWLKKCFAAFGL